MAAVCFFFFNIHIKKHCSANEKNKIKLKSTCSQILFGNLTKMEKKTIFFFSLAHNLLLHATATFRSSICDRHTKSFIFLIFNVNLKICVITFHFRLIKKMQKETIFFRHRHIQPQIILLIEWYTFFSVFSLSFFCFLGLHIFPFISISTRWAVCLSNIL